MTALPDPQQVKDEIAREIARVHAESYGEAATNVEVSLHESFVAVVMDVDLSRAEQVLVDAGDLGAVRNGREAFQAVIGDTFRAIVERATGRRVDGFASRMVIGERPPWAVELFRLA